MPSNNVLNPISDMTPEELTQHIQNLSEQYRGRLAEIALQGTDPRPLHQRLGFTADPIPEFIEDEDDDGVSLNSIPHPTLAEVTVASATGQRVGDLLRDESIYIYTEAARINNENWFRLGENSIERLSSSDLYTRSANVPTISSAQIGTNRGMYKLVVYIGYDERQDLAYRTCKESILLNTEASDEELSVRPLKLSSLREKGLYYRAADLDMLGRRTDAIDGKPFSTDFSFSRFLVPILVDSGYSPVAEWYMFVDSDFVFKEDIMNLLGEADPTKPISVVKHNYKQEGHETKKMDNQWQTPYNRKLWSSLMLFNDAAWQHKWGLQSEGHIPYNVGYVNTATGSELHQLKMFKDEDIGSLSESWNFIPDHSEGRINFEEACAVHYTEGTPLMPQYRNCKYADTFNSYLGSALDVMSMNGYEELDN